jgi:hypothetical protein
MPTPPAKIATMPSQRFMTQRLQNAIVIDWNAALYP